MLGTQNQNMRLTQNLLRLFTVLSVVSVTGTAIAQSVDTVSTFSLTGYVDAYYASYTDSVGPGNFQKFPSVSPRSDNPSLNTAQLSMQYNASKVRATAVLHFGDIAASTWAPAPYDHIMEAHVGFKVTNKFWIDGGFFRSHLGTELLLPSENIASSIAVGTYFEPYYESGIRFNFDPTKKLEINLFLLSGYNVFIDNNNKKSVGLAVTYAFNDHAGIGYTNYIGDESLPGDKNHMRLLQNLFFNYQRNKIKLQVGGDFCMQQNSDLAKGTEAASAYSALATLRYQLKNRFAIYGRGEMFNDPDGCLSGVVPGKTGKLSGLKLFGFTAGAEYKPTEESYVKLEGRLLQLDSDQEIFMTDGKPTSARFEVMVHAGITFELLKSLKTKVLTPVQGEPATDPE